jgi:hypothetical protein
MKKIIMILFCYSMGFSLNSFAQLKIIRPDLSKKINFQALNRQVTLSTDELGKTIVHLNANDGAGVVWINDLNFTTGIIEFDVKGKDVLQKSFVGIAFHGVNDSTYESIYFRPFNFQAADTVRKKHAVQYISLPNFDWPYLRETSPNKYEHDLVSFVDPDKWFHAKIVVDKNRLQAFLNSAAEACLSVEPLTHQLSGKIGFWVGNGSDGDFTNLTIEHK